MTLLRGLHRALALGTALLLLTIAVGTVLQLRRTHEPAPDAAREALSNAALIAEHAINRQLLEVDSALIRLPAVLSASAGTGGDIAQPEAGQVLHSFYFENFVFRDVLLVGPERRTWAAARPRPEHQPLPSAFAEPRQSAQAVAVDLIGPVLDPSSGSRSWFLLCPLELSGPRQLTAVAEIPVQYICDLLAPIRTMPGLGIELIRRSGTGSPRERDAALRNQNMLFDSALNDMAQSLALVDLGANLIVCNQRFLDMFGLAAANAPRGSSIAAALAWLVRCVCVDMTLIPAPLKVAINLSPHQLDDDQLIADVSESLAYSGAEASRFEVESTESVLLSNSITSRSILLDLRRMGATIALDDSGSGYLSLSCLTSFPHDKLKMDRSFISQMAVGHDSAAIVRSIVQLTHQLHMQRTAEGA